MNHINTIRTFVQSVHFGEWTSHTNQDDALAALDALEAAMQTPFAWWVEAHTTAKNKFFRDNAGACDYLKKNAGGDWYIIPLYAAPRQQSNQTVLGWINEDELPKNYPYDAMFPHSKVDGVRLFPVFGPSNTTPEVTMTREEIEALRLNISSAVLFLKAENIGDVRANVLTRFDQFFAHVKEIDTRPKDPEAVAEGLAQIIFEAINPGKVWTYQTNDVRNAYWQAGQAVKEFLK